MYTIIIFGTRKIVLIASLLMKKSSMNRGFFEGHETRSVSYQDAPFMSFGSSSWAGIGTTTKLGYVNSIGKDLIANGRFIIGEDVRWTSFCEDV
jgi:hypothetical protein